MMLTGGEKYNVKTLVVKINEIYSKIQEIISNENYEKNQSSLMSLYDYTLDIFIGLSKLTTNIINGTKQIQDIFNMLQQVHYYKDVNSHNKIMLVEVVKQIPQLQEELINLVESDTTNRDSVLRQIMDELGIVDPNAKKKRSLW